MNEGIEQFKGLFLKGTIQVETAHDALRRHDVDSEALKLITTLLVAHEMISPVPEDPTHISLFVDDSTMTRDLVSSLRKSLANDDLDQSQRGAMEELLSIQELRIENES